MARKGAVGERRPPPNQRPAAAAASLVGPALGFGAGEGRGGEGAVVWAAARAERSPPAWFSRRARRAAAAAAAGGTPDAAPPGLPPQASPGMGRGSLSPAGRGPFGARRAAAATAAAFFLALLISRGNGEEKRGTRGRRRCRRAGWLAGLQEDGAPAAGKGLRERALHTLRGGCPFMPRERRSTVRTGDCPWGDWRPPGGFPLPRLRGAIVGRDPPRSSSPAPFSSGSPAAEELAVFLSQSVKQPFLWPPLLLPVDHAIYIYIY